MKRLICLLLAIMCVVLLFAGCKAANAGADGDTDAPEKSNEEQTTAPEDVDLPEYVPGSVKLCEQWLDEYPFQRKYRLAFYGCDQIYEDLLTANQREEWNNFFWSELMNEDTNWGETLEEMVLVTMVKRYNIPREEFEKASAKLAEVWAGSTSEWDEVPNADIIYTFDNEIINNFYRYE